MGFRSVLSPDDLKKGDLAEPGWHPAEITKYEEKDAETDKSTNCIFHWKLLAGPNKGVSPRSQFNEKALGFGKNLYAAVGLPFDKEKGYDLSSEVFKGMVGSKVDIYIKRGESNKGNPFNEVKDYAPLGSETRHMV